MFRRFVVPEARRTPEISVRILPGGCGNRVCIEEEGKTREFCFEDDERTFGFLYARFLDHVTRRDPGLICVHAAALSRAGSGVVLAAPSRHGKSTLALALVVRGFRFFSDEVAPIRSEPPKLVPFPMAIACRRGTCDLFRIPRRQPSLGKALYDPPGAPAESVPLRCVFFIEPDEASACGPRTYRLLLDRPDRSLAQAVRAIDGVLSARPDRGGSGLVLEVERGAWVAPAVEGLLESRNRMACEVVELNAPRPDFNVEPRLRELATTEGVISMFRHLRGFGAFQDLVRCTPGGFGGLLGDLADKMRNVDFYHLTPGRLPSMVECIESAVP